MLGHFYTTMHLINLKIVTHHHMQVFRRFEVYRYRDILMYVNSYSRNSNGMSNVTSYQINQMI